MSAFASVMEWVLHGTIGVHVHLFGARLDGQLYVREVLGNIFGLASAVFGMRRLVWAWPVGLVGNVLLFTVFVSGELSGHTGGEPLWGQAGRQVMFVVVSVYGWWRWWSNRHAARAGHAAPAVVPHWAGTGERLLLLALAAVGYLGAYLLLGRIGSYSPATEAWILAGSLIATWGMARGWVEFWLVWIAVDVVGVTTLVHAGYYPTAAMYLFYGGFCLVGFAAWWRDARRPAPAVERVEAEGAHA